MPLRKFETKDLALCIDMYLDFANALAHGEDDAWTENAVAERIKGILESPVFCGFTLEDEGVVKGFLLGTYIYAREGVGWEILELFSAPGQNVQEVGARMLRQSLPLLKAEHVVRINALSTDLWDSGFYAAHGFLENKNVKLFEHTF